jgi:DNA-binding Lrp family transcriptional regulator
MLPNAIEAEEALLGSILLDPAALSDARSLSPDDFYRLDHQTIFARIRELEAEGTPVDYLTLAARLDRRGELNSIGGQFRLLELVNTVPTSTHAPYYADLVKKAADGRKVVQVATVLAQVGYYSSDPAQAAAQLVSEQLATPHAEDEPAERLTPEQARDKLKQLAPTWASLRDLMAREYPPTLWVVPGLLPEGLTLLAAKPKLGKSWMALGLALAVAAGGVALGQTRVEPGAVLYLALEDSPKRLTYRTRQLLGDAPAPERLTLATESPRLDDGGLAQIDLWLQATPGARLVILDTLAKLRGRSRSSTLYGDDYASLEAVQKLAHHYGVGILVIHHTGKESRDDALDEVNATQGLNGVADNILVLRRERGKADATLIGDGRELNGIELSLAFDTTTGAWSIVEPRPAPLAPTPAGEEIVRYLLAIGRPAGTGEIAEATGRTEQAASNLVVEMETAGTIIRVRRGVYKARVVGRGVKGVKGVNDKRGAAAERGGVINVIGVTGVNDEEDGAAARALLFSSLSEEEERKRENNAITPSTPSTPKSKGIAISTDYTGVEKTAPPEEAPPVAPATVPGRPQEPTVPSATPAPAPLNAGAQGSPVLPAQQAPVAPATPQSRGTAVPGRPQEPLAPGLLPNPGQQPTPHLQTTTLAVLETLLLQPERFFTEEAVVRCAARLIWRGDPANRDEAQPFLEHWLARFGLVPIEKWDDWLDMEHQALYYELAIIREAGRR